MIIEAGIQVQLRYGTKNSGRIITYIILLFTSLISFAQTNNSNSYLYISPIPGSSMILPESNIIIKQGDLIDKSTLLGNGLVEVVGSKSVNHSVRLFLYDDGKTIIFKPVEIFNYGEMVSVIYKISQTFFFQPLPPFRQWRGCRTCP